MPESDVAVLDRLVAQSHLPSRSAGIQLALRHLADAELRQAYSDAWEEYATAPASDDWDATSGDGLQ